jgi:hypothetical protein
MRPSIRLALLLSTGALAGPVAAVDTTLTAAGFTGLGITPNAHLLSWGRFEGSYDNDLPGVAANPRGHNFVGGFGLLPNLEVAGRIASNTMQSNCFSEGCGARDLSASAKLGIGLDANNRYRLAVGAADIGGHVTYFRSVYGVISFDEGPVEINAGLAHRSGAGVNGSKSPLNGPFAAAALQPLPWIRGHVEYSDRNAWTGASLFAPNAWLPEGWAAYIRANIRLTRSELTSRSALGAGVSIPLYKVPTLPSTAPRIALPTLAPGQLPDPSYEARRLAPPLEPLSPVPPAAVAPPPSPANGLAATQALPAPDVRLEAIATALQRKGLEDIWVGRMPDNTIAVRVNNASYNWNSADALGATLGVLAQGLSFAHAGYRLILTQRQIPLVAVTGQADCLRQWISRQGEACTAGQLSTPGTGALEPLHDGVTWVVKGLQPSSRTLRVAISPALRTKVATEVGVLDYSIGANVGLALPLWQGASVELRRDVPLANSNDYAPGAVFGNSRIRNKTERFALTQTVRLPLERWLAPGSDLQALRWGLGGVTAQGSIGRFGTDYDGVHGAVRWEPGEGRHRLSAQAGYFHNSSFGTPGASFPTLRTATPLLAEYRYNVAPTRTYVEATGGQFMNNDRGLQIGMRQWFSDLSVGVYVRRTSFSGVPRSFAGMEISVPIGPRRDFEPVGHVQVTGTPRFSHAIETVVGQGNVVATGYGILPPVPSLESTFNSDRAGLAYFEDNIRRIRDAAR